MNIDRYHDAIDHVLFDPHLEERVLSSIENHPIPQQHRTFRPRILAVVIASALFLAITAGAYGHFSSFFAALFNTHPEIIDLAGTSLSASTTSAGYTLTADALFGDKNCLFVAMTLTRTDGSTINADDLFVHLESIDLPGYDGGGYGARVYPGQGVTDRVSLAATLYSFEDISQDKTLTLSFDRLAYLGEDMDAPALAEGNWSLSFPVHYGDLTQTISLEQPIAIGNTGLTLDTINISPLSVWVYGKGFPQSEDALGSVLSILKAQDFTLTLQDGTVIDLFHMDGDLRSQAISHVGNGCYSIHLAATFTDLIPLEDMDFLSVGGVVLPLELSVK